MPDSLSILEFLWLVRALQATDTHGVATPEGWQPGDLVIVSPPQTSPFPMPP